VHRRLTADFDLVRKPRADRFRINVAEKLSLKPWFAVNEGGHLLQKARRCPSADPGMVERIVRLSKERREAFGDGLDPGAEGPCDKMN